MNRCIGKELNNRFPHKSSFLLRYSPFLHLLALYPSRRSQAVLHNCYSKNFCRAVFRSSRQALRLYRVAVARFMHNVLTPTIAGNELLHRLHRITQEWRQNDFCQPSCSTTKLPYLSRVSGRFRAILSLPHSGISHGPHIVVEPALYISHGIHKRKCK